MSDVDEYQMLKRECERLEKDSTQQVVFETVGLHHMMHSPEANNAVKLGVRKDVFIRCLLDEMSSLKKQMIWLGKNSSGSMGNAKTEGEK